MPTPKYQIFVSATYEDLKEERDAVIRAVLDMGHIPVGMAMFGAANEQQWKIIKSQIDESDYYMVIVAHRYGSIIPELRISYTEREYDYAISQNVPILRFMLLENANWPHLRMDQDTDTLKELNRFKEKLMKSPVRYWLTVEDLHSKTVLALINQINIEPRPGWIRATEGNGPEVTAELARLSRENEELRTKNAELQSKTRPNVEPPTMEDFPWLDEELNISCVIGDINEIAREFFPPSGKLIIKTNWRLFLQHIIQGIGFSDKEYEFTKIIYDYIMNNISLFLFQRDFIEFVNFSYGYYNVFSEREYHRNTSLSLYLGDPQERDIYSYLYKKRILRKYSSKDAFHYLTEKGDDLFILLDSVCSKERNPYISMEEKLTINGKQL